MPCVVEPDRLYEEVCRAAPYHGAARGHDRIVDLSRLAAMRSKPMIAMPVATRKKRQLSAGAPALATRYRMNVGTIVEAPMLKVRLTRPKKGKRPLSGGRIFGEMEEYFLTALAPGDTFVFAGETFRAGSGARYRGAGVARLSCRPESADLSRRQISHLHPFGRTRARHAV